MELTPHPSSYPLPCANKAGMDDILVLGDGAVVRECYIKALAQRGLLSRTTFVDTRTEPNRVCEDAVFVKEDFRNYLDRTDLQRFSWCIVALPNHLHYEAAKKALQRGINVLCEKPLALRSEECLELSELADAQKRTLAVNMIRRLFPGIEIARTAREHDLIGDLLSLEVEHGGPYAWPARSIAPFEKDNGGVTADMGIHYLDLLEWFAGPLKPVAYEDDWKGGVEAEAVYSLVTAAGISVKIQLSRIRQLKNTIELTGSRGRMVLTVDLPQSCTFMPNSGGPGMHMTSTHLRPPEGREPTVADCFALQLELFLRSASSHSIPHVGPREAARTVALLEWAYGRRSSTRGKHHSSNRNTSLPTARVLVSGATGFIGSHLVERLANLGFDDICVPVRNSRTCANVARFPVKLQEGNLLDYSHVRTCLRGVRYVFHLAYGRDGVSASEVSTRGTRNVVDAAIEEGCECVVVLSSMYVFGQPNNATVTESYPYRPIGGEYGKTKSQMEQWCLVRARESGATRIAILCPSCVYGPRGTTYSEMPAKLAAQGAFCWVEQGVGVANITFVENLIDAIVLAASHPAAHGKRFIINDGWTTWREFLGPLIAPWQDKLESYTRDELKKLSRRAGLYSSFMDVCRAISRDPGIMGEIKRTRSATYLRRIAHKYIPGLAERLKGSLRAASTHGTNPYQNKPVPPAWLADLFGTSSTRFSAERARRVLGWMPQVDFATGQARTIQWLKDTKIHPAGVQVFPESRAGESFNCFSNILKTGREQPFANSLDEICKFSSKSPSI